MRALVLHLTWAHTDMWCVSVLVRLTLSQLIFCSPNLPYLLTAYVTSSVPRGFCAVHRKKPDDWLSLTDTILSYLSPLSWWLSGVMRPIFSGILPQLYETGTQLNSALIFAQGQGWYSHVMFGLGKLCSTTQVSTWGSIALVFRSSRGAVLVILGCTGKKEHAVILTFSFYKPDKVVGLCAQGKPDWIDHMAPSQKT